MSESVKPAKPKKEKPTPFRCIEVANEMASRWSDDFLLGKKPSDLVTAYGVKDYEAFNILKPHREQRGL